MRTGTRAIHYLLVLPLVSMLFVSCTESDADIANGDAPLRSLTVPHRSDRYGTTYWTRTTVADPELWAQALVYCEHRMARDYPNCDTVRYVDMMERMSRLPEDRPDTFRLTVPRLAEPDTTPDPR